MSYVVVSAAKAKELAHRALDCVARQRKEDELEWIKERLEEETRKSNSWWGRFMRRPIPSPGQIIERDLAQDRAGDFMFATSEIWSIRHWRYRNLEKLAEQVLAAASIGDPVHLDLEDAERLAP